MKQDEEDPDSFQAEAKDEASYSIGSGHFLTGEEGSSSSFADASKASEDSGNAPDSDETWIQWYTRQRGNEMLCQVDQLFLYDQQNFNGMRPSERHEYDFNDFKVQASPESESPIKGGQRPG